MIIALPNAFFDSITGQFIEAMESKMNKEEFSLGTLRTQTYDLKFTKARFIIADNKLSAVFISRNNTQINFYQGEPSSPVMLEVVIKNMSFEYGLRYEVDTSPDYFDDRGTGRLAVENMTLVIRFSVVPRDGRA